MKAMQLLFLCRLLGTLLFAYFFSSCSEPQPDFTNVTFDYSGVKSGTFKTFGVRPDPKGQLFIGSGDSSLSIVAIHWIIDSVRADYFTFSLHSKSKFAQGQQFYHDSLSSQITNCEIGLDAPLELIRKPNGGSFYKITDSSGFHIVKMTLTLSAFYPDLYEDLIRSSFSGTFMNSKGEQLDISNGNANWIPMQ
jgi:hypothetical protein